MASSDRVAWRTRTPTVTRRRIVTGAVATGAALSLPFATAEPAAAVTPYLPPIRPYKRTPLPDVAMRHMANRFAYGYLPALRAEMAAVGGPLAWFEAQLDPDGIRDGQADDIDGWWPTLRRSAAEHASHTEIGNGYAYQTGANHARWSLIRRIYSRRQVHEVMTEFWNNHLHVYGGADHTWMWRHDYDALIRRHALGRFDDMLKAATVHPTMLSYLDADLSQVIRRQTSHGLVVKEEINENLGRELLELHTVGRSAGYAETEVRQSAYLLTGWTIDRQGTWKCNYDPDLHYTGPVQVLDFTAANQQRDGRPVLDDYLHHLAHHPATARRIARKLALRFVSDTPSDALVEHLAEVFSDSGTDITTTLRALVAHPEFTASAGMKVRTPTDDVAASIRVLGAKIKAPVRDGDAANAVYYISRSMGQVPFGWEQPDGFPDVASAWSSGARMMGSYRMHYLNSGGYYPRTGVNWRLGAEWLPEPRIRFDAFVDHLCRVLHGRPSTPLLLGAASIAVDVAPSTVVSKSHVLIKYRLPKLLGLLLDAPAHLTK